MRNLPGQVLIHVDRPCHESLCLVGIEIRHGPDGPADHTRTCPGHHFGAQTALEEEEEAPGWVLAYDSALHRGLAHSENGQETFGLVQQGPGRQVGLGDGEKHSGWVPAADCEQMA